MIRPSATHAYAVRRTIFHRDFFTAVFFPPFGGSPPRPPPVLRPFDGGGPGGRPPGPDWLRTTGGAPAGRPGGGPGRRGGGPGGRPPPCGGGPGRRGGGPGGRPPPCGGGGGIRRGGGPPAGCPPRGGGPPGRPCGGGPLGRLGPFGRSPGALLRGELTYKSPVVVDRLQSCVTSVGILRPASVFGRVYSLAVRRLGGRGRGDDRLGRFGAGTVPRT